MKTGDELKTLLMNGLIELGHFEEQWSLTIEERSVKEQDIGRHCYEAEENLTSLELERLKQALRLSKQQWQTYKAKFIAGSAPGGMV